MSSNKTELAIDAEKAASNPLDVVPDEIPFDVPYGLPISLDQAQAVIHAAVAEAKKRNWKMNVAVADSGGNLVAFQRMDGAMLASIQIAEHKARAAATFRRPTKVFEDGINLMHQIRHDWDLSAPGLREAWNAGDLSAFHGWNKGRND